jgi:hypothetical protein
LDNVFKSSRNLYDDILELMGSNSKTLEIITVETYPDGKGGYKGQFILPLTYDVNITNELTSPSAENSRFENDITNATGQTSYSWLIDDNYETGTYSAYMTVTGQDGRLTTVFKEYNVTKGQ